MGRVFYLPIMDHVILFDWCYQYYSQYPEWFRRCVVCETLANEHLPLRLLDLQI